jgi:hypothetical protein
VRHFGFVVDFEKVSIVFFQDGSLGEQDLCSASKLLYVPLEFAFAHFMKNINVMLDYVV